MQRLIHHPLCLSYWQGSKACYVCHTSLLFPVPHLWDSHEVLHLHTEGIVQLTSTPQHTTQHLQQHTAIPEGQHSSTTRMGTAAATAAAAADAANTTAAV